jgi:hypothetical protein
MEIDVRTLDLKEAFNLLKTLDDGSEEYNETERKAINGELLKFSIFDKLNERNNIVEKGKIGKVIINGHVFDIKEYDKELMRREKIIKSFLIDKLEGKQIARPRGLK